MSTKVRVAQKSKKLLANLVSSESWIVFYVDFHSHTDRPTNIWPYRSDLQSFKNKTTFFFPYFKLEKAMCSCFCDLWPRGWDKGIFYLWGFFDPEIRNFKGRKSHISAPGPKINKIRPPYFLQLSLIKQRVLSFVFFGPKVKI